MSNIFEIKWGPFPRQKLDWGPKPRPYNKNDKSVRFCGCCHDSVFKLAKMDLESRLALTDNLGIKNIVIANELSDLDTHGLELVEWCVDFLLFNQLEMNFPKKDQNQFHKEKYINLFSFVYGFLQIPKESGFDYWLMSFLNHVSIMDHGSSIRCGWYVDHEINPYFTRVLSEERKNKIIEWATNAPDDI